MTSDAPTTTLTDLGGSGPLLLLGPSLGTRASTLWGDCAEHLTGDFRVMAWDLPGHGASATAQGFTTEHLAAGVLAAAADHLGDGERLVLAGDSLGGAVALEAALLAPQRVAALVVACSGPRIGDPAAWRERAASAREGGLRPGGPITGATPGRWFGPGFSERSPDLARRLLDELSGTDPGSYAACCEALAGYDVRSRLADVQVPVLAVAGAQDAVTPTSLLRHLATGVPDGRLVELDGVAHLAPAEAPRAVATLIADHAAGAGADRAAQLATTRGQLRAAGMRVRREVLGDAHVDRAGAAVTPFTADFQTFITEGAWGSVWTRPGLDRRSRSVAVLTALVARGHHEELAMHLRAALRNGLTVGEIQEVLLQSAVYCGVPDANTAFRIAASVLHEEGAL